MKNNSLSSPTNYSGLTRVRVAHVGAYDNLAWAEGMDVFLPAEFLTDGGLLARFMENGELVFKEPLEKVKPKFEETFLVPDDVLFTPTPPTSSRLPFNYQLIPPFIRDIVGRAIGKRRLRRLQSCTFFPAWPLDLSADFLSDLLGHATDKAKDRACPVILSHDLDSQEGVRNAVEHFLPLEREVGALSANFIVTAQKHDHGLLDEIVSGGHELGIHGYNHGNQTPFLEPAEIRKRLQEAMPLIERYNMKGYRAPSLLRTRALYDILPDFFAYDSSIPTSGGLFPVAGNGCASARLCRVNNLPVMPLTMPRDGSLLFLGHKPDKILELWKDCAILIARSGGIVNLLTHCERRFSGNKEMLSVYREFLGFLGHDDRFCWSSASDEIDRANAGREEG